MAALPTCPDSAAPSQDCIVDYQNKIKFLKSLLRPAEEESHECGPQQPLPQGSALARDTVSKQIYQKMAERQNLSSRDQLLGSSSQHQHAERAKGM